MTSRSKNILIYAIVMAAIAVLLGAFGAHKLKELISIKDLAAFETGVRYQFYHAIGIMIVVLFSEYIKSEKFLICARLFIAGVFIFSGSLYILSTRTLIGLDSWDWLGAITPLGGLCFIAGWIMFAYQVYKVKN